MKIRNGFVSNSSSSSFHIYGTKVDECIIAELLIDGGFATEEDIDEDGVMEYVHKLDTNGLQLHCINSWDEIYIGRSYSSIEDDETGRDFKTDATECVTKFFGKEKKCEQHFKTYYD